MMNLYKKIEKTIRQHEEFLFVGKDVAESDIRHAIRQVMRGNPDIFWFAHQYHFDKEGNTLSFRYQFSKERSKLIQRSIDDVIENDFQVEFVRSLSIYEQVMYVYKWLLTYCNYNVNSAYNQSIDSVFVRRNSVCTGYAKAAQYLFKLLGIESSLVFGRLNNDEEDGGHCWNIIQIENQRYHLDICLGDISLKPILDVIGVGQIKKIGNFYYNFFCISTKEIQKSRKIEDVELVSDCNSCLDGELIQHLADIEIKHRDNIKGCLLSSSGHFSDIYLCAHDKHVVLKVLNDDGKKICKNEEFFMQKLTGCEHLLQIRNDFSDSKNEYIAIEQATPIIDLFCSHYFSLTIKGLLSLIRDISKAWIECKERGVIYRDIHLGNIYFTDKGVYKLGDFGNCTANIKNKDIVGNLFIPPETIRNGIFDESSAIYSTTMVFYYFLNGMKPVSQPNGDNMENIPIPSRLLWVSPPYSFVIMKAFIEKGLAFFTQERIQSFNEYINIIDHLVELLDDNDFLIYNNSFNYEDNWEQGLFYSVGRLFPELIEKMKYTGLGGISDSDDDFAFNNNLDKAGNKNRSFPGINYFSTDPSFPKRRAEITERYIGFGHAKTLDCVERDCNSMAIANNLNGHCNNENNQYSTATIKNTITYQPSLLDRLERDRLTHKHMPFSRDNSLWSWLPWSRKKKKKEMPQVDSDIVFSSIFAPAEVKCKSPMHVQVYIHLYEETEMVSLLAVESDRNAERRDYIPLQCKLKKGDKVDVQLNIYGEVLLMSEQKSVIWQGSFTKCSFDYFVPKDIDVNDLSCVAMLSANSVPVGEMRFITKIVETPRKLNPEIIAHKYSKVFISYSHQDESKVKFLHEGLELGAVPHFFDRKYLKAGDVFPQVIQDYINSADLFILCWSENASKSEYVQKERLQALERAFPQVRPEKDAKLRIYPMSIEPRAELPSDMKEYYHFGEI